MRHAAQPYVSSGSWPCKNTFPGEGGEKAGPVVKRLMQKDM